MKKIFSTVLLFAFMFTNVSFAPAMAATYQQVQFRNEVVYPPTTTQRVTQTVTETETVVTETTSRKVYEEPVYEQVVVTEQNVYPEARVEQVEEKTSAGEIVGMAILGTLLVGGVIALAAIDDGPSHHHHPKKHHKGGHKGGPHGGHKPPHRR